MKVSLFFVILVFMCSGVLAVSGVSPASYSVDFDSEYSQEFVFNFVVEGKASVILYAEGDLAKYVSFDKDKISGMEKVVVNLNLPSKIENPGINNIKIGARNSKVDIVGVIKVNVPYPEKYVEVDLSAPNINSGEEIIFELEMIGKGDEAVVVSPRIEIYKNEENIEVINIEDVEVFYGEKSEVNVSLNTEGYFAGDYLAIAFLDYEDMNSSSQNFFKVGGFSVELVNYTKHFRKNKINRFEILVENSWGDDMEDVYAEVNVLDFPSTSFSTSPENFTAWERKLFVGFFDTLEIEEDSTQAEIILHYGDESFSQVVDLEFVDGVDYVLLIIITLSLFVFVFLVWRGIIFIQRIKKHGNK